MEKNEIRVFNRELFVKAGSKGGKIGGQVTKNKYDHDHFVRIGKMGGRPKKKKEMV